LALNLRMASQFGNDWKYHAVVIIAVGIRRLAVAINYISVW